MLGVAAQRIVHPIRKPCNNADERHCAETRRDGAFRAICIVAPLARGACHGRRVASRISSRKASVAAMRGLFRGSLMNGLLEKIKDPSDLRRLREDQLPQLAKEVRDLILGSVSQTGGHLSSNLGTVELTIALHYVFDTPRDRLVLDGGHPTPPHKILTRRPAAV